MEDNKLGRTPIGKLLFEQSVPAAMGILVLSIYSLVDTVFIGHYIGSIGLGAVTLVFPITILVSAIGQGVGIGGSALISIKLGEKNHNEAKQTVGNQTLLILLFSFIIVIIGFIFQDQLLRLFGAHDDSLVAAKEYYHYTLIGMPFFLGQMVLNCILRAGGMAKEAMLVLGIPSFLNIVLDAWFILGLDMGLNGAALATTLSMMMGVILGVFLLYKSNLLIPALPDFKFNSKLIKSILSLGTPQLLNQTAMALAIIIVNVLLMQHGGDLAVSGYGLALRIIMFALFPIIGIVQGYMPIAGFNFGAGNNQRVSQTIKYALFSSTMLSLLIMGLVMFFSKTILRVFTTDVELIEISMIVVFWMFCSYPLVGIQRICTSYFQVIGKAKPALYLTLGKHIIFISTILLLPFWFALSGIWYTFVVAEWMAAILALYYFYGDFKGLKASGISS